MRRILAAVLATGALSIGVASPHFLYSGSPDSGSPHSLAFGYHDMGVDGDGYMFL